MDAALLVPGDMVLLASGSSVPADCLVRGGGGDPGGRSPAGAGWHGVVGLRVFSACRLPGEGGGRRTGEGG